MPTAWRIVKSAQAATAFDGEGARLHGGRWNSPGTPMVYTSHTQSLAALELLIHLQASHLLLSYSSIPANFDSALVQLLDRANLPADWRSSPAPPPLQEIGDRWVAEARSVVLQVPSTIVPSEPNFLFNPGHPDFDQVAIGSPTAFEFDPRLK